MKTRPYFLTYLSALIVGILLIIFTGRTDLFRWIVIAAGILIIIPSAAAVINGIIPARDSNGMKIPKPGYIVLMGVAGIICGVILICIPGFFAAYIVYTLGVILILCGLAQIVYMSVTGSIVGTNKGFYIMPWLTFIAGIVVIFIGPRGLENIISLLAGIFLTVYAINGFLQMGATRQRENHKIRIR